MIVENPPLAPWQVEHIRKMQEGLGMLPAAADAEEVTMDEDMTGGLPQVASADDADVGGLAVYSNPNVQTTMTAFNKLAAEQQARYDAQAKALAEKRYGPSFSERMFQLSAALAQPTTRRGFGAVLGNVAPVLAAQEQAKRKGEISRREALEKLDADRLAAQMGLAKQDLSTAFAMAKLEAMANKPVRGVPVGDTLRNPYTGAIMEPPPPPAGTTKVFEGLQYTFIGGDQYDKNNWKVVK